jgi:hypothetical protein
MSGLCDSLDEGQAPARARSEAVPLLHSREAAAKRGLLVSMQSALSAAVGRTDTALLLSRRRESRSRASEVPLHARP